MTSERQIFHCYFYKLSVFCASIFVQFLGKEGRARAEEGGEDGGRGRRGRQGKEGRIGLGKEGGRRRGHINCKGSFCLIAVATVQLFCLLWEGKPGF